MSEVARLWATFGADTSGFKRGAGFVKSELGGLSKSMNSILPVIGSIGAAIGGAFAAKEIIEGAKAFNKQLTNIESLGGRTTDQMNELRNALLMKGGQTFLAGGADAMVASFYDIASGVQSAEKQMSIFNAAVATAEAGQADLTATTAGLVSFMNAYNLKAEDATKISNMFSRTVGLGVGTMTEFVSAMSPIAGLSAQMGVDFNELGAAMAFLTTKGVGVSESATQIQSTVSALLTPNEAMLKIYKQLGIQSGQWAIKNFGLVGTLKKLKGAVNGSEQEMGEMLGRVEAVKGAMMLSGDGFDAFFGSFNTGLSTATEEMRKIQANSPEAIIERFGNQVDALGKKIGTILLPPLGKAVEFFSGLLSNLNPAAIDQFISGIGNAISNFNPATFIEGIQNMLGAAGDWMSKGGFAKIGNGLHDVIKGAADWLINTGWPTFKTGMEGLWNGIVAFMQSDGVTRFKTGLVTLLENAVTWLQIQGIPQFVKAIGEMYTAARDWVFNVGLPQFGQTLNRLAGTIWNFFRGPGWENFKKGLGDMFNKAKVWIETTGAAEIRKAFESLAYSLAQDPLFLNLLSVINPNLANMLDPVVNTPLGQWAPSTGGASGNAGGGGGFTPFAKGGFAPIGTRFMAGEAGPEFGIVGSTGTTFRPMYSGGGGGGSSVKNINIMVIDRDLESRIESILEREIED